MYEDLKIIDYPDPRLRRVSVPVTAFDAGLRELAGRMLELMREARGVGLAAPQVGQNIRLFVINPTGEPGNDRVYVNPALSDADGAEEGEEGCLSLPGITAKIVRSTKMRIQAHDLDGNPIDETADGYITRIWQHEFDHLNGKLIIDRMGPVAKIASRKKLRELEEVYAAAHPPAVVKKPEKKRLRRRV